MSSLRVETSMGAFDIALQEAAAPVTGEQLDPPIAVTRFSLVAASQ